MNLWKDNQEFKLEYLRQQSANIKVDRNQDLKNYITSESETKFTFGLMKVFSVQTHSTNSGDNTEICMNNKHFMLAFIFYIMEEFIGLC